MSNQGDCIHESRMVRSRDASGVKVTYRCVKCGAIDRETLRRFGHAGDWIPHSTIVGGVDLLPEWHGVGPKQATFGF